MGSTLEMKIVACDCSMRNCVSQLKSEMAANSNAVTDKLAVCSEEMEESREENRIAALKI